MSGNHLTVPHAFSLGLTSPCGTYERHDKMFPALQGPEKMGNHLERETEKSEKNVMPPSKSKSPTSKSWETKPNILTILHNTLRFLASLLKSWVSSDVQSHDTTYYIFIPKHVCWYHPKSDHSLFFLHSKEYSHVRSSKQCIWATVILLSSGIPYKGI